MSDVATRPTATRAGSSRPGTWSSPTRDRSETRDAYLSLAPYLLLFAVFVLLPIGLGIWISLCQTFPAGLSTLRNANVVRYDLLMAGAVIASVPVLVLYLAKRYVVEGVSRAGLKG